MIHYWRRIIRGQFLGGRPGKSSWVDIFKLRNPPFNVVALRIVGLGLRPRVLDAEIGSCVCTCAGAPLPTTIVGRDIAIDELLHEILFTFPPMDVKIFRQEHGHNHPGAVVHEPGCIQLTYPGIDNGKTGCAFTPASQLTRVRIPPHGGKLPIEILIQHVRKMPQDLKVKLAPDDFIHKPVNTSAFRRRAIRRCFLTGRVNFPR